MKNRCIKVLIIFLFINVLANAQNENLEWTNRIGGLLGDDAKNIIVDAVGNVYTTGQFNGIVDFDPEAGIFNMTASSTNVYISKFNSSGALIWAKQIQATAAFIRIDNVGNVYVVGHFMGTIDLDPGLGVFNVSSAGGFDVFVSKLSQSGDFLWGKQLGSISDEYSKSITIDLNNEVTIIGSFVGTVDFDPSVGVASLTSIGFSDIFISKFDENGTLIWAKQLGGVTAESGNAIVSDIFGNIYIAGDFQDTIDFDPGIGIVNLESVIGAADVFILKLDALGDFVWAKQFKGGSFETCNDLAVDTSGNLYSAGIFEGICDFNPGGGVFNLTSSGMTDIFISKLDVTGNFVWAKKIGQSGFDVVNGIALDKNGNVYTTGLFQNTVDFNPGVGVVNLVSAGITDIFISKLDAAGNFVWAKKIGGANQDEGHSIAVDINENIYCTGIFWDSVDFDPNIGVSNLISAGDYDVFVLKLGSKRIKGVVYQDFNQNCTQDINDINLGNRTLVINPGNWVVTTNSRGLWFLDSLVAGNYSIIADTLGTWTRTCPFIQNFTVSHSDSTVNAPSFGFVSLAPCQSPNISVYAPFWRVGFLNTIYVQVCNNQNGTSPISNADVIIQLDSLITIQSGLLPYTNLGNNKYQISIDTLYPGQCANFWLGGYLSMNAILGQTLCIDATLYPIDSCALDDIPNYFPSNVIPCNTPYDFSHLVIRPECNNDTISFVIQNTGDGDMSCLSQVRLYIDGVLVLIDSIQLASGDTAMFVFSGNGQTWRLEVDQHPLHFGNSNPSSTIELCGNAANWTSNLVNIFPQDDADPVIDIFCGVVTGSYDPNDKTGYPLGVGSAHDILPNQDMEYVIRFQNTGTDTAFTVVVRDTLSTNLDIFSVRSGASSHDYTFRMYGPRVLEWTFGNIMLPDSNVNEAASHGFVTFKVRQAPNLSNGTLLENSASIYFDFNAPIFTNVSRHTINDGIVFLTANKELIEQQLQIKVYPNPTTGILHIDKLDNGQISILVSDNLGRTLMNKESNDVITDINLGNLPTGVYYVTINNGKQIATQKVVKQ